LTKSLCGGATADYSSDIGENCPLSLIRRLLVTFFDSDVIVGRLSSDLYSYFRKESGGDETERGQRRRINTSLYSAMEGILHALSPESSSEPTCWNEKIRHSNTVCSRGTSLGDKLTADRNAALSLASCLLRGPLPQILQNLEVVVFCKNFLLEMKSHGIETPIP